MGETLDERLERCEREIRESFDQCRVCFYTPASDCIVAECPWRTASRGCAIAEDPNRSDGVNT